MSPKLIFSKTKEEFCFDVYINAQVGFNANTPAEWTTGIEKYCIKKEICTDGR